MQLDPTRGSEIKKHGKVILDQIRTVDKNRLLKRLGKLDETQTKKAINELQELFA